MNAPTSSEAEQALLLAPGIVASSGATTTKSRMQALEAMADYLRPFALSDALKPAEVTNKIIEVAQANDLMGVPGSDAEGEVMRIAQEAVWVPPQFSAGASDLLGDGKVDGFKRVGRRPHLSELTTIAPPAWAGTKPQLQRWVAQGRIPAGDLTILSRETGAVAKPKSRWDCLSPSPPSLVTGWGVLLSLVPPVRKLRGGRVGHP